MSPTPAAQIILSTSRTVGLVAVACGEEYQRARHAVEEAGFRQIPGGAFAAPLADGHSARTTASALVHRAHEHGATITTSLRPYLGDIGQDLAARLPGTWSAELEIYSHPLSQEDLVPALWDCGELLHTVIHDRVPYAVVLKSDTGAQLLLIERPGPGDGYLLGAFATEEYDDNSEEPNAPRSVVLPASAEISASLVARSFLPAYRRALHNRHLDTVIRALDRIRTEHQTLNAIRASGRFSDGVPLASSRLVSEMERAFADHAWLSFREVLEHAPVLLPRCRPAATPWPQDAAALARLRDALADSQDTWQEYNDFRTQLYSLPRTLPAHEWSQIRSRLGAAVLPAIETWLTDSEAFERQARAAVPGGPVALSAPTPRLLTARLAQPATPRTTAAHR